LFSVLSEEVAHLLVLLRVLPSGETWVLLVHFEGEGLAALSHCTKSLLPLVQVDVAVLPDVNEIEKVLHDRVGRDFYIS
jgi:hypothetical protein